jgi:hypothetical protein
MRILIGAAEQGHGRRYQENSRGREQTQHGDVASNGPCLRPELLLAKSLPAGCRNAR